MPATILHKEYCHLHPSQCPVDVSRPRLRCQNSLSPASGSLPTRLNTDELPHSACIDPMIQPTKARSIEATYGSLFLQSQSLSSSASVSFIVANEFTKVRNLEAKVPQRSLRKRPGIHDLQKHHSIALLPVRESSRRNAGTSREKSIQKRSRSAGPDHKCATRFMSPDRYTAVRSTFRPSLSPLRTSNHPSVLSNKERLVRNTMQTNVFRSTSESITRRVVNRPVPTQLRSFQPPHHTPSFAHGLVAGNVRPALRIDTPHFHQPSFGNIWRLGSWDPSPGQLRGIQTGTGSLIVSGSTAPMVSSNFFTPETIDKSDRRHESRLAFALEIDMGQRVLPVEPFTLPVRELASWGKQYRWSNGGWNQPCLLSSVPDTQSPMSRPEKAVPAIAFRVLDAPRLKDDYYCSVLAYCRPFRTLAVALAHRVYLWTEKLGVRYPPLPPARSIDYVTSMAFSSDEGKKAILAVSRHSGKIILWSLLDRKSRVEISLPSAACSVAFRPKVTQRMVTSTNLVSDCEDLLVGDDVGRINYYTVEWPEHSIGSVTLLVRIEAHSQNVCGLAWAPHGDSFVSGGNDNNAMLFLVKDLNHILEQVDRPGNVFESGLASETKGRGTGAYNLAHQKTFSDVSHAQTAQATQEFHRINIYETSVTQAAANTDRQRGRNLEQARASPQASLQTPLRSPSLVNSDFSNSETVTVSHVHRHSFYHSAAVKALAFAPWQPTLLATGGGSNDKQIHFHHTETGTTLAVINVYAQVTSLAWSMTRREIVATFGYAQPEHEIRIAVFAWPSCECVMSIPWERKANGEIGRALWAIPYPGGPNDAAPERLQRTSETRHLWGPRWPATSPDTISSRSYRGRGMSVTSSASATRNLSSSPSGNQTFTRGEGETWASRTEEEGSLVIACCDQTVKFFEVWAGKSKGKNRGLGSKAGVLGGSKVLEGWCEVVAIEEVGGGEDVVQ